MALLRASMRRQPGIAWALSDSLRLCQDQLKCLATLAYETVCSKPRTAGSGDSDKQTALIVHGLLGSGRNWRTFSRMLANEAASTSGRPWKMVMVDQRNHGASSEVRGFHPPHSIEASAGDLLRLVDTRLSGRVPDMLVGHSLGGKTVLEALRQLQGSGQSVPKQVWVLDSPLGETNGVNGQHSDTEKIITEILGIPLPVPSREWLYNYMTERGYSTAIQQWLGSNLIGTRGGFKWAFEISGAAAMFSSYRRLDCYSLLQQSVPDVEVHIVRAALSDRWSERELQQLEKLSRQSEKPKVKVHVLPKAGHWLHVDNAEGLLKLMSSNMAGRQHCDSHSCSM